MYDKILTGINTTNYVHRDRDMTVMKFTVYAAIFIILLSLWGFYLALRPFRYTSDLIPRQVGANYENVSFQTSDNITIKGWFIPSKRKTNKTIILLHGYPADKGDILPSRIFLHNNYNLLFIDFRYFGESGGYYSTIGMNETKDIRGAIDYLKSRGINQIGIWGLSMGGAAALLASGNMPEVKAIVAESPYAHLEWMANKRYPVPGLNYIIGQLFRLWGKMFLRVDIRDVNPVNNAASIKVPLLLMYSRDDQLVTYEHARAMIDATKNNPNVRVVIYGGKTHNEPADNYQLLVDDFLEENLR